MKEKTKLVNKVKHLIRRAGCPRWLHHFGPKKYEFLHHALAYIVKQECRLGYRRVTRLLRGLGVKCPCPSALCISFHKQPLQLWQRLLRATIGCKAYIVALDGTGMSRPLPSPYYYRRIDKPYPIDIPLKLSFAIDTRTKKVLSLRLRAKKAHDIRDVKYLVKRLPTKPKKIVADKGYDAYWLRLFCKKLGISTCIPLRQWSKSKHNNFARRNAEQSYHKKTYGRREMVESVFGAVKRKFGASVSSVKFSAQRAEMYCRAIAHNIFILILGDFERSQPWDKLYK